MRARSSPNKRGSASDIESASEDEGANKRGRAEAVSKPQQVSHVFFYYFELHSYVYCRTRARTRHGELTRSPSPNRFSMFFSNLSCITLHSRSTAKQRGYIRSPTSPMPNRFFIFAVQTSNFILCSMRGTCFLRFIETIPKSCGDGLQHQAPTGFVFIFYLHRLRVLQETA